jgi:hypothetical protein
MRLIQDAYAKQRSKADTVALKKRMDTDRKQYKKNEDDWSFWDALALGLRKSPDHDVKRHAERRAHEAKRSAFETADRWAARRDTLNAARQRGKR